MQVSSSQVEITVIMITRNRRETLRGALESVLRQAEREPRGWEIVVVDNGSSDGTAELVKTLCTTSPVPMRAVVEPELGASSARNRGFREAKGELMAFLDDDIRLGDGWISSLRRMAERFPDAAAFGGRVLAEWSQPPPRWLPMSGPYRVQSGAYVAHDFGDEAFGYRRGGIMPLTANCAIRRSAWRKYGGFRTDLDRRGKELLSGGDTEFFRRLVLAGERVIYMPEVIVYHPAFPDRLSKAFMRRWYFHLGRSLVRMDGVPKGSVLWAGAPRYMFRELLEALAQCCVSALTVRMHRLFFYELRVCSILGRIREARRGVTPMPPPPAEEIEQEDPVSARLSPGSSLG